MPKAQKSKELENKSIIYPHDAHLAFIACCIENPEVLEKFDKMRDFYSDIIPYIRLKKEPEKEIISFEDCSQNWRKAAHQLCSVLTYVLGKDNADHMRRYLMAVPDMPNAKKHIMPGTGNTNPELFNKREFVRCLAWPISHFDLYKGHSCCNQPMTHKWLVQLLIGADFKTGEVCQCRSVADFGKSNADTIEYWFKHRGSNDAWSRALLDLYLEQKLEG